MPNRRYLSNKKKYLKYRKYHKKPRKYRYKKYSLGQKVSYINRKLNTYMKQYTPENQLALVQVGPEDWNYTEEVGYDEPRDEIYGNGRSQQWKVMQSIIGDSAGMVHFKGELIRIKKLIIYYKYQMIGFMNHNNENIMIRLTIGQSKVAANPTLRIHNCNDLRLGDDFDKLYGDDALNCINGPLTDDITTEYKILYDRKIYLNPIKPSRWGKFVFKNLVIRRPTANSNHYKGELYFAITSYNDSYQRIGLNLQNPAVLRDQ